MKEYEFTHIIKDLDRISVRIDNLEKIFNDMRLNCAARCAEIKQKLINADEDLTELQKNEVIPTVVREGKSSIALKYIQSLVSYVVGTIVAAIGLWLIIEKQPHWVYIGLVGAGLATIIGKKVADLLMPTPGMGGYSEEEKEV